MLGPRAPRGARSAHPAILPLTHNPKNIKRIKDNGYKNKLYSTTSQFSTVYKTKRKKGASREDEVKEQYIISILPVVDKVSHQYLSSSNII